MLQDMIKQDEMKQSHTLRRFRDLCIVALVTVAFVVGTLFVLERQLTRVAVIDQETQAMFK